jgi:hypothetical protein
MPVTIANSPLHRRLDGQALTTHTYLSIEVIDPYITTQADGIHTFARRMNNEIEKRAINPQS